MDHQPPRLPRPPLRYAGPRDRRTQAADASRVSSTRRAGRGPCRLPRLRSRLVSHQPLRTRARNLPCTMIETRSAMTRPSSRSRSACPQHFSSVACPATSGPGASAWRVAMWSCGAVHPGLPITHRRARRRKPSADRTQSAEPDVSQGVGVRFERGRAAERMSSRRFWPIGAANRAEWR